MMMNTPNQPASDLNMFSLFSGDNPELVANPFALFAMIRSLSAVMPLPFSLARSRRESATTDNILSGGKRSDNATMRTNC